MKHKSKKIALALVALFCIAPHRGVAIECIDLGQHTIIKVREAQLGAKSVIIGATYDGVVVALDYDGTLLWCREGDSATIIHDVWCDDITGDDIDEVLIASGDGYTYCIDGKRGELLWRFIPTPAPYQPPMYSVTIVKDRDAKQYVVCGSLDGSIYYLSTSGKLVKSVHSSKYSDLKGRIVKEVNIMAPDKIHYTNFLRPLPLPDGSDLLVIHANNNHMQGGGRIYLMEPLAESLYANFGDSKMGSEMGDLRVVDPDGDGKYELLYGASTLQDARFGRMVFEDRTYKNAVSQPSLVTGRYSGPAAYRVSLFLPYYKTESGDFDYVLFSSNSIFSYDASKPIEKDGYAERVVGKYTYFDYWNASEERLLVASSQDGGSCIYVIDTKDRDWMQSLANNEPRGKIAKIKDREIEVRKSLATFKKPTYQRDPVQVIGYEGAEFVEKCNLTNKAALELYQTVACKPQDIAWRSKIYGGTRSETQIDKRMKYVNTKEDIYEYYDVAYNKADGISFWGGHGNDPLFFAPEVLIEVVKRGAAKGKKTILVWPEMNSTGEEFDRIMENHIMPIAQAIKEYGGKISLRAKNIFYQGPIYTPTWSRILSGEFADTFIIAMEESTDKTQDLSFMGRMGLWMSGAVDGWAIRCTRDDSSFDRSRQFSSQRLANHFLRKTIYSLASGAKYIHNAYSMNPEHMSLVLELLDKEALYVPKREELLSISPVHLSVTDPTHEYLVEGENHKFVTMYSRDVEENEPMVFSHMSGTWLGASLTPWDFSTYASGVKDRRQNFVPSYPYGMVLITPVQEGVMADAGAPRGKLIDKLHPIYRNIMKEYITNGSEYLSKDGKERYAADKYYTQVAQDIEDGANKLPIVVRSTGGTQIGWVVAQVSSTHLRVTLVDGGSLNPNDGEVEIIFNGVTPKSITDILENSSYSARSGVKIDIPCGMFRFLDIELESKF